MLANRLITSGGGMKDLNLQPQVQSSIGDSNYVLYCKAIQIDNTRVLLHLITQGSSTYTGLYILTMNANCTISSTNRTIINSSRYGEASNYYPAPKILMMTSNRFVVYVNDGYHGTVWYYEIVGSNISLVMSNGTGTGLSANPDYSSATDCLIKCSSTAFIATQAADVTKLLPVSIGTNDANPFTAGTPYSLGNSTILDACDMNNITNGGLIVYTTNSNGNLYVASCRSSGATVSISNLLVQSAFNDWTVKLVPLNTPGKAILFYYYNNNSIARIITVNSSGGVSMSAEIIVSYNVRSNFCGVSVNAYNQVIIFHKTNTAMYVANVLNVNVDNNTITSQNSPYVALPNTNGSTATAAFIDNNSVLFGATASTPGEYGDYGTLTFCQIKF